MLEAPKYGELARQAHTWALNKAVLILVLKP